MMSLQDCGTVYSAKHCMNTMSTQFYFSAQSCRVYTVQMIVVVFLTEMRFNLLVCVICCMYIIYDDCCVTQI